MSLSRKANSTMIICALLLLACSSVHAFSLYDRSSGNFMDSIINVSAPLIGGPVQVGNETVDSITDAGVKAEKEYRKWALGTGESLENVHLERILWEKRISNARDMVNKMYQLIVHTLSLVFDTLLLAFLLAEMILIVTLFTRWIPMLFRKLIDNTADFIRRRTL